MTQREAKEFLRAILQNSDAFRGIGLGKDCLSVLWDQDAPPDDQPPFEYHGWRVRITYIDKVRTLDCDDPSTLSIRELQDGAEMKPMKQMVEVYPRGTEVYVFDHVGIRVMKVVIESIHFWGNNAPLRYIVKEIKGFTPIYFLPDAVHDPERYLVWSDFEDDRVHETIEGAMAEMKRRVAEIRAQYGPKS